MITTVDTNLTSCSVLSLIEAANREQVAYHLNDDRLVIHPHRTRQDIVDALLARSEEVRAFLTTHRPNVWRTPPEEEAYRRKMADEMTLEMFGMEWQALVNITIDALAERVGEAWERHANRITPLVPVLDGDYVVVSADDRPVTPVVMMHARPAHRRSFRGGGSRG